MRLVHPNLFQSSYSLSGSSINALELFSLFYIIKAYQSLIYLERSKRVCCVTHVAQTWQKQGNSHCVPYGSVLEVSDTINIQPEKLKRYYNWFPPIYILNS